MRRGEEKEEEYQEKEGEGFEKSVFSVTKHGVCPVKTSDLMQTTDTFETLLSCLPCTGSPCFRSYLTVIVIAPMSDDLRP